MSDLGIYELCAQAAYEVNRVYCLSIGEGPQPHWEDTPEWYRCDYLKNTKIVINGSTPERNHECWLAIREQEGWKYGPIKDPVKKEHPYMLPYLDLPLEVRTKYALFITTIKSVFIECYRGELVVLN